MTSTLPMIIQGGMGVAVSDWRLARAVALTGQMGVVSGTALDVVLVRRLQMGDPGGHMRRALEALPFPGVGDRIVEAYFVDGGLEPGRPFTRISMPRPQPSVMATDLLVAANFVEVHLAREGHSGQVGINYLEKIQLPTLPSLFGAMVAGVDFVLMGAGIPRAIPAVLDRMSHGEPVSLRFDVDAPGERTPEVTTFDPATYLRHEAPPARPGFLGIVASHVLATMMTRLESPPDGFIVEGPTAGGHNAPPRGRVELSASGEPVYGERDVADLETMRGLGLPFWLAGGQASAEGLANALASGAAGIQVGTAFAFCTESGLDTDLRQEIIDRVVEGRISVFTDPQASPTGFPFKVVLRDPTDGESRRRTCDLGYLRTAYRTQGGAIGWRCPAEPVDDYVHKGGIASDTEGRRCLCNALMANIGLGQLRDDGREPPFLTAGDDVVNLSRFLAEGASRYSAADVVDVLIGDLRSG